MCIFIASGVNVKTPDKKTLKRCFETNPDGAGYAYTHEGYIHVRRGLMTFNDFYKAFIKSMKSRDISRDCVVIHFRIKTNGTISPENTHPFLITNSEADIAGSLSYKTKSPVLFHNGMISSTRCNEQRSDTYCFVRDELSHLIYHDAKCYRDASIMELLKNRTSSRLCILDTDGFYTTDNCVSDIDGIVYSNETYKLSRYNYNGWSNRSYNSGYYSDDYGYIDGDDYNNDSYGYIDSDKSIMLSFNGKKTTYKYKYTGRYEKMSYYKTGFCRAIWADKDGNYIADMNIDYAIPKEVMKHIKNKRYTHLSEYINANNDISSDFDGLKSYILRTYKDTVCNRDGWLESVYIKTSLKNSIVCLTRLVSYDTNRITVKMTTDSKSYQYIPFLTTGSDSVKAILKDLESQKLITRLKK